MLDVAIVLFMILFAAIAIQSKLLRHAIIALTIFSLFAAVLFLVYAAPELAIAEVVMGSGLVTLLYLTALKRYRFYRICIVSELPEDINDRFISEIKSTYAMHEIRMFCRRRERELQLVFSNDPLNDVLRDPRYHLVMKTGLNTITIYGVVDDYMVVEMELVFQMRRFGAGMGVNFVYYSPEDLP